MNNDQNDDQNDHVDYEKEQILEKVTGKKKVK